MLKLGQKSILQRPQVKAIYEFQLEGNLVHKGLQFDIYCCNKSHYFYKEQLLSNQGKSLH